MSKAPRNNKNFSNTPPTTQSYINGFTNKNNRASKPGSITMTPNTLSPPPGMNLGSNISKLNFQNLKSKNQDERNAKYKNLQNVSLTQERTPHVQTTKKQKQFVSMQEALGFLNYMNLHPEQAFNTQMMPFHQINQAPKDLKRKNTQYNQHDGLKKAPYFGVMDISGQKSMLRASSSGQLNQNSQDQHSTDEINESKKKLNKNRAIKRIIQTAFGILQKNYRYDNEQSKMSEDQRSTTTQFSIYLKQYNRIIEQINSKQIEEIQRSNNLHDKNQEQLQEVFEYIVMDDFRQKISLAFSKQKISKNNVDMMISAFRDALVILKFNQLKIQFCASQQPAKAIKMSEIQNVQYFTQPYIFIVLTINKDKTKSKQYLYLKFISEENMDKWDRALYCCFMSRKMNKKQKLFQIEFPVEDVMKKQKEEHIKDQQFYNFNQQTSIIKKCFSEQIKERASISKQATYDDQHERNMLSDRPEYMNLPKNRNQTQQKITISILNAQNSQDVRRLNTVQNKNNKHENSFKNSDKNQFIENLVSSRQSIEGLNQEGTDQRKENLLYDPQSQQSGNLSKKSTFNINGQPNSNRGMNSPSNFSQTSQNPLKKLSTSSGNPFLKLLKIAEEQSQKDKKSQMSKVNSKPETPLINEQANLQKMRKLKRIRQIQKNNVRGIVCQKQKFFMNKQKILFFHDQSMINSSRSIPSPQKQTSIQEGYKLQNLENLSSAQLQKNKFFEYWDYDYKKDTKQQQKLIPLKYITQFESIPSQLGQTTSTLFLKYDWPNGDKIDKKQLRLIFANMSLTQNENISFNKADQTCEWISLIKYF